MRRGRASVSRGAGTKWLLSFAEALLECSSHVRIDANRRMGEAGAVAARRGGRRRAAGRQRDGILGGVNDRRRRERIPETFGSVEGQGF